ncbi:MAG: indolepyruvate oxidoreductase subunit beta [Bacillota bacterium]|jgi:indolepyruvate ferredoxin oxidoreductase beta subunit|nr:indolepyruvate oxidoreductase subunit beta [Bacillota bacterium]
MSKVTSILLAGVGGQGIVLASRVLAEVALKTGNEVKVSEIHGMAQRGGSVVTHLRFGKQVFSPLISPGQADFLVGFEKLEAIRLLPYLKQSGYLIVNDQEIFPLPVLLGKASYPDDIIFYLRKQTSRVHYVAALEKAQKLGSPQVVNMILLGVLAQYLGISPDCWEEVITKSVRSEFMELNRKAFREGLTLLNRYPLENAL